MEKVTTAFHRGQIAHNQGCPDLAINHFTDALEVFRSVIGHNNDPIFWSKILFARAYAFLILRQYYFATDDIKQALNDCPQQLFYLVSFIIIIIIDIVKPVINAILKVLFSLLCLPKFTYRELLGIPLFSLLCLPQLVTKMAL